MMRREGALVLAGASVLVAVACYGPTEVRVEITTDQPCIPSPLLPGDKGVQTAVALGAARGAAPETEVSDCTPHEGGDSEIGSIVIAPSGARDARVTVQVSMTTNGRPNSECVVGENDNPPSYCILARRSFAFIEHTSRVLPIKLYGDCRGVRCPIGQTCGKGGGCRSDAVGPDDPAPGDEECSGKCGDAGGTDGADATPEPDASIDSCTLKDGGHVLTTGTPTDNFVGNSSFLYWLVGDSPTSVEYVPKDGSSAPLKVDPNIGELTAIAANDTYVWIGTTTGVRRFIIDPMNKTLKLDSPTWTDTRTVKIALLGSAVWVTREPSPGGPPGASRPIDVFDSLTGVVQSLDGGMGTKELTVTPSYAYGVDFDGLLLFRHTLANPGYAQIAINPGRFLASIPGSVFFTAGPSLFGPTTGDPAGVYRIDEGVAAPSPTLVTRQPAPWNIAATDTAIFYVSRVPNEAAVRRLLYGAPTPQPTKISYDFADARGLVADKTCVYFWATQGSVSKLYASDMKTKPTGPAPTSN